MFIIQLSDTKGKMELYIILSFLIEEFLSHYLQIYGKNILMILQTEY